MQNRVTTLLIGYILLMKFFTSTTFRVCSRGRIGNIRLRTTASGELQHKATPLRRFWSKEATLNVRSVDRENVLHTIKTMVEDCNSNHHSEVGAIFKDLVAMTNGLIMISDYGTIIPVHSGKVQMQHVTNIYGGSNFKGTTSDAGENVKLFVCGFSARAQDGINELGNEERKVDIVRKEALDAALLEVGLGLTGEGLLGDEFSGLPPGRIYRSFVCPRPSRGPDLTPIHKRAVSIANQIQFAVRQVRADKATYLRNTDRSGDSKLLENTHVHADPQKPAGQTQDKQTIDDSNHTASEPRFTHPVVLVLDNLRSAENVGGIFRTAETAGAQEVITCGITPHPPHPKLAKTALQSLDIVPTRHFADPMEAVKTLKREGYTIAVLETTSMSTNYTNVTYPQKTALVFGNEVTGVDTQLVEMADMVLEIPTYGVKNSLNVASAASISLFEVIRQWHL